jgi:uncharacterized protein (TIGR00369 family)
LESEKEYKKKTFEHLVQYLHELTPEELETVEKAASSVRATRRGRFFLAYFLDFKAQQNEDGSVTASIPVQEAISNGQDMVHGGIIATLADSAMGLLAETLAPEGHMVVTSNLNITYLSPGRGTRLDATARAVKVGRTTVVMECMVCNESGKEIALATATFFHFEARQKETSIHDQ